MPLRYFYCPDGSKVEVDKCLKGCPRAEGECLTQATLHGVAEVRDKVIWRCPKCGEEITTANGRVSFYPHKGEAGFEVPQQLSEGKKYNDGDCSCGSAMELVYKPSTTELINGTMLEFLRLTRDYSINPRKQGFRLAGTRHHSWMEEIAELKSLDVFSEETLDRRNHTGRSDVIEEIEGGFILYDYKLWGSFKVAKALGLVQVGREPDPAGGVYQRKSKYGEKGEPKTIPVFGVDPSQQENLDTELQLSDYAIGWEEMGFNIVQMKVQATIRDAGTTAAVGHGFEREGDDTLLIPIERLANDFVNDYFVAKSEALLSALSRYKTDKSYLPELCTERERWDGIRCERFCEVKEFCPSQ